MMERRAFISAVGALLGVTTFTVEAQPAGPRRIGYLSNGNATATSPQREAFRRGLHKLGWIEGQTVTIEYRWVEGNPDRLPALVAELVSANVEVIVLSGSPAIRAARQTTTAVPVVFILLADPVTLGFVSSLARPGGNMTGLASQFEELITKQLQLLKETLPNLSRVALLHRPETPPAVLTAAESAARSLGLTASLHKVAGVTEFENAFKAARSERAGAVHVFPSPYFDVQRAQLIDLAARYRLPAIYEFRNYAQDGGLMSYGPSINEMYRDMASYVDRILKGANPGDLAIERPSRFELVTNIKTAKALGLTIPQSLLLRADEVISASN
jgi:putative ABC transport system substrate-binding protein